MLTKKPDVLLPAAKALAERLAALDEVKAHGVSIEAMPGRDAVGAGSLPTVGLEGAVVALQARDVEGGALAERLRAAETPVFTTVHEGRVLLHVRTLLPGDEALVVSALQGALPDES